MSLDTSARRLVQRVMRKIGTEAIIRRVTVREFDEATSTVSTTETDTEVVGRLDDYTDRERLAAAGAIKTSDRKFTFAAADIDVAPEPKDRVVIDDLVYTVVEPGGVTREMVQHEPGLYVLQLRR